MEQRIIWCLKRGMILIFFGMQIGLASVTERSKTESQLLDSALAGGIETVNKLLAAGVHYDVVDENGRTPLLNASWGGYYDIVKTLLKAGADKEAVDMIFGHTPLHEAAEKGHEHVVDLLLEHRVNTEVHNRVYYSRTPLHSAVKRGHRGVVKLLIEKGADKEARDYEEYTPLHWAAMEGHEEIVEMLLNAGVSVNQRSKWGRTPLFYALDVAIKKPEVTTYEKVAHMLMLFSKGVLELSDEEQDLLKKWGTDYPTVKKRNLLLQEHFQTVTHDLESCHLPTVIISLIIGYYDCMDTRSFLCKEGGLLVFNNLSTGSLTDKSLHDNNKQGCIVQ